MDLAPLSWPGQRLDEALEALARHARVATRQATLAGPPDEAALATLDALGRWLETAGERLGVEVDPVATPYPELEALLTRGAPLLLRVNDGGPPRFLLSVGGSRRSVRLLTPRLTVRRVPVDEVRAALCQGLEEPTLERVDRLLADAGISGRRHARARAALLAEYLAATAIGACWLLRLPPEASFPRQLRQAGLVRRLAAVATAHAGQQLLLVAAWWLVGRGALSGRLDSGWLQGWVLILLTMVSLLVLAAWLQGHFFIGAGALLKRRLLAGVLRTEPETVRSLGAGHLLGRVLESQAVEAFASSGGYLAVLAAVQLTLALAVLSLGAGGGWHALLLVGWTALTGGLAFRVFRARDRWTESRLALTHDLVERMVGHRTRLAQQPPALWHAGEDALLAGYLETSRRVDDLGPFLAAAPAGWRTLGVLGLAAPFVAGTASPAALAVGLGGVVLGAQALELFVEGLSSLAGVAIAWKRVAPLFRAAADVGVPGTLEAESIPSSDVLVEARNLVFRYPGRPCPALDQVDLTLRRGERLLLVGPSGGGKSTLAGVLTALRPPESGLLLVNGLDLQTVGHRRWQRLVTAAPQFHENHVLTETFSFNLLLGRRWPPERGDLEEAEQVCRELGLGELLERMPAGLAQMVGETGWQLSHGERSRLFVARALLQRADLVILDESFGALDPANLRLAVDCARARAATLMVIAHP